LLTAGASAGDWPAYRHDARRSAVSEDRLEFPLRLTWRRQSARAPRPAFADPLKHPTDVDFAYIRDHSEPVLLDFDHAFHPVAADGRVFIGSSADDSVRCFSLDSGQQQWSFVTGGPVRFAPHVVGERVYVASDDGFVYCLGAAKGDVVWRFRAAPSDRKLVGNGRMISRWPLRSGVLVSKGVVYATAGMWPAEGVFVYALDAETGDVRWVNDTSGTLNQPTANRGAYAIAGVAPTGYLLAAKDALVVPTGRSIPASYSQIDGRLLASAPPSYQNRRGGPAVCVDQHNSVIFGYPRERLTPTAYGLHYAYQLPNMTQFGSMRADRILAADRTFLAVNDVIRCIETNSRYTKATVVWQQPCPSRALRSLSLSQNALLIGVDDRVVARDRATGELLWEQPGLDGYVQSVAVADNRLLVATDRGSIYCFATNGERQARSSTRPAESPGKLATEPAVLRDNRIRRGMALVMGQRDTKLAARIAASSRLQVVLLLNDTDAVLRARRGLLDTVSPRGGQVSVALHDSRAALPFADYAFNLIAVTGEAARGRATELYRVLRPAGGELHISDIDPDGARQIESEIVQFALRDERGDDATEQAPSSAVSTLRRDGRSIVFRRGKLPGALDWDSQTLTDQRVRWPLELLWFGGPGSKRTGGGSRPPIAAGGRNFVIGKNHLIAIDAYNGTELWSRTLPYLYRNIGRLRNAPGPIQPWLTESVNADDNHVWLNFGRVVHTLDATTGEQLGVHGEIPPASIMPLSDEGVRLVMDQYQRPGSRGVTSQKVKSKTAAGQVHVAIADNGRVEISLDLDAEVAVDRRVYWELFLDVRPPIQRANLYEPGVFQLLAWPAKGAVERGVGVDHPNHSVAAANEGRRLVVSIPTAELEQLRGGPLDDFCIAAALNHPARPDQKSMAGGRGYLRWEHHADALATAFNNGWPRIVVNETNARTLSLPAIAELPERALRSGRIGKVGQRAGSVVKLNGRRASPLSLEWSDFEFNRGKGCGRLVSSGDLQVLRSGTLAFYDVNDDSGMRYFGGVRPACTISAIPAQGLVFAAEGSSGCSCNYNFKTTLALAPAKQRRHEDWAMFTAPLSAGAQLQTGRFNLAAPGDRRDSKGGLWLQYPRAPTYSSRIIPSNARTMPVPVQLLGGEPTAYRVNADRIAIENTDRPWLYASGYRGIEGVRLRLFMSDKEGIVVFPGHPPTLDAKLEPTAWERRYSAPAGTGGSLFLSHDEEALYVGYEVVPPRDRRGKQLPWTLRTGGELPHQAKFGFASRAGDEAVWEEDSLEFLIGDSSLRKILHFGVGVTGGRYDGVWVAAQKQETPAAALVWAGTASVTTKRGVAEFAIPWKTLAAAGLNLDDLVIRPRTKRPLTRQPHISHGFRPVILKKEKPATKRYRVTLHFAELDDVAVGDRVFDIQLQGQTVVRDFDPVASAKGRRRAVSQTFESVAAERTLEVRFPQRDVDGSRNLAPILSAIEAVREQ
jgi:outer membrane protein assembly factor BamB